MELTAVCGYQLPNGDALSALEEWTSDRAIEEAVQMDPNVLALHWTWHKPMRKEDVLGIRSRVGNRNELRGDGQRATD